MLAMPTQRRPPRPARIPRARAGRLSLSLLLALVGSAGAIATLGAVQAFAAPLELVPAYFSPEGTPGPWRTMCEAAPPGSSVILNPDNGPVKREAKVYAEPMRFCEEHGQRVIGYVFTDYGKRRLATVEQAITDYYSWYPTIEGIFLDEMAENPTKKNEAYYEKLGAFVHEKDGFVIGNPGDTATTAWQLAAVNAVVTFEGSASAYAAYAPAAWVLAARPQQIANIIFAASETSRMEADCVKASEDNAGSIYVTNLPERPNPYQALPSYWATETARC